MDFERMTDRHKDAVFRQIVRVCGNQEDAEDALTEALLQAYKASDQLRNEEAFRAWLITIGRRVCIRLRRKEALYPVLDLSHEDVEKLPEESTAQAEMERKELKQCIQCAMASLPEIYLEVYKLREVEGLSAEDVSEKLGLSIPAVKSRLHRARKLVREALDQSLCADSLVA